MEGHIILLLLAFIVLAAQGYYFGFVRPPEIFAWLQQTTFVVMTFMLIPFMILVLWSQAGAVARLSATGITPHPDIRSAVGAATGHWPGTGWVFRIDPSPPEIQSFYRVDVHRKGWEIVADSAQLVVLSDGEKRMAITLSGAGRSSTLIYTLME